MLLPIDAEIILFTIQYIFKSINQVFKLAFVLLRTPARADSLNVFKTWHVAFHGTRYSILKSILDTGDLLMAGKRVLQKVSTYTNLLLHEPL